MATYRFLTVAARFRTELTLQPGNSSRRAAAAMRLDLKRFFSFQGIPLNV
jgi:hypothetical protein